MNKPLEISLSEWEEICQTKEVRELWGLTDENPEKFAARVYGVKFDFSSGSPGYVGDLFILQGNSLSASPVVLTRNRNLTDEQHSDGTLEVEFFD